MNLSELHRVIQRDGVIFLSYGGFLSQALIAAMTESLEKEAQDNDLSMRLSHNIFTVFIELTQNMMKYIDEHASVSPRSEALIIVGNEAGDNGKYFVVSRNVILNTHIKTIEKRLTEIKALDRESIRKQYRELRRSGRDLHYKGAGIGFYEIAKCAEAIEYEITALTEDTSMYVFKATVGAK